MEKYEKRTKYLDYVEHGNKLRNGGVLRTEMEGENCRVQITVKGLYPTDTIPAEIYLEDGSKQYKADAMMLHYGTGSYNAIWTVDNLAGSEITYAGWCGITLVLSEHRHLRSKWEMVSCPMVNEQISKDRAARENEVAVQLGEENGTSSVEERENKPVADVNKETEMEIVTESLVGRVADMSHLESEPKTERSNFAELYEDKWTQLGQHYRTVRPFGDKRTYLSIAPNDFIILGEKYQRLVGNSFLLHGYYNYGHLILAKIEKKDEYGYYIGVPGIYHEREIQAARMFGFEGFEGATNRHLEGGFGYYMLQVEI